MTDRRPPIGMADALAAARALGLSSAAELSSLVRALGMEASNVADEDPGPGVRRVPQFDHESLRSIPTATTAPAADEPAAARNRRTVVEELESDPVGLSFLGDAEPLAPTVHTGRVPYRPPFPPNEGRAALAGLVRRPRRGGSIDLEAITDALADQRPIAEAPWLVEMSLAHGVTIVADLGPSMLPYLEDVSYLVKEVRQVTGADSASIDWSDDGDIVPVTVPDRPVLVISTLGAAHPPDPTPGTARRWRAFAEALTAMEADVVAFVPHRRHRWPTALSDAMKFVSWDEVREVVGGRD